MRLGHGIEFYGVQPPAPSSELFGAHAHTRCQDAIGDTPWQRVGPLVHRLPRAANTPGSAPNKMKTVSFLMGGESYAQPEPVASSSNPEHSKRSHTSLGALMNLLDRIDIALQHARKSRGDLAEYLGCSVQHISGLARSPNRSLKPDAVARAARFLRADIYWMCTGEGGKYVPDAHASRSFIAHEVAKWIDEMTEAERHKVFTMVYALRHGKPFDGDNSGQQPSGKRL